MLSFLEAIGDRIEFVDKVDTWENAVRIGGKLLREDGIVAPDYIDKMIEVCKELGPYIAIAPKVAIPHARPEDGAKSFGVSLLIIREGINFGSHNDPIHLVISFATPDKESHLRFLQELAKILEDSEKIVEYLINSKNKEEIKDFFKKKLSEINS
ncbi:PTS sugar transporter subunit IIA [Fervidobacterium pennivorans subsp. shakshaketiis]|uniref:PTS sugar transporter subunit IIA n=1 Tax=Fervidobacterium TaxID=2422 RepID=UPI00355C4BD5